jgi:PleD family two-component response regulator
MRSEREALHYDQPSGEEIGKVIASFGVAELDRGAAADGLFERADERLYQAKCTARNRVATGQLAA